MGIAQESDNGSVREALVQTQYPLTNREKLKRMLVEGASKHGWATDLWTTK